MKIVKKNVYYCDHCKKHYLSKRSCIDHELHCTKNPGRKCKMCDFVCESGGDSGESLANLIAILDDDNLSGSEAIKKVREMTDCPICILSAIRQCKDPVVFYEFFNYKEVCAEIFADLRRIRRDEFDGCVGMVFT